MSKTNWRWEVFLNSANEIAHVRCCVLIYMYQYMKNHKNKL